MEYPVSCWADCGEEFLASVPADRGSPELIDGIPIACPNCGETYSFTVDGDGEPDLEYTGEKAVTGEVIDDPDATHY